MRRPLLRVCLLVVALASHSAVRAHAALQEGEEGRPSSHGAEAVARLPVSDDAEAALARLTVPEGFTASIAASEPALLNPVAFGIDQLGRFFVVESFRVNNGVTDMREHMDWLEEDLAIQTVEERVAMYRRNTPEADFERLYATGAERITRLVDHDRDGVMDESTIFADGFSAPADGVAAGILPRVGFENTGPAGERPRIGSDVLFTCIPSLYRLQDTDGDGLSDRMATMSTGYGLRVALLGHDLHGLVIGPDMRLYFSIGDRGFNVHTDEGQTLARFGVGAVLRCELDGSGLEVFCDGLRNPQEIVFDDWGNLFTLDNNSDAGDKARWTLLLEGSDSGWRQAYQWIETPHARGPWDEEGLWKPHFEGQPAYILPPIANVTDGPSGLVAYPGAGFGDKYAGSFFVCDFRGAASYSGIWNLRNEPAGSGFRLAEAEKFIWNALPTDVDFGPDGAMYWTDWVNGWGMPGKGRLFRVAKSELSAVEAEKAKSVSTLFSANAFGSLSRFGVSGLAHDDRRVRQEAAIEQLRRNGTRGLGTLVELSQPFGPEAIGTANPMTLVHSMWVAGAYVRRNPSLAKSVDTMIDCAFRHADPRIAALAVELLETKLDSVLSGARAGERLRPDDLQHGRFLKHESPVVLRRIVKLAGEHFDRDTAVQVVIPALSAAVVAGDTALRHTAICALERLADESVAISLLRHSDARVRRCAAVVLRRMKSAEGLVAAIVDEDPGVRAETAAAIYDAQVRTAMEALSALLEGDVSTDANLTVRRALHASREVASPAAAARLAAFARREDVTAAHRAEALAILRDWELPLTRDGIVRDHRPLPGASIDGVDLAPLHTIGFARSSALDGDDMAQALVGFTKRHCPSPGVTLATIARAPGLSPATRGAALEAGLALARVPPAIDSLVQDTMAASDDSLLPLRAIAIGTLDDGEAATRLINDVMIGGESLRREALRVLGQLSSEESAQSLVAAGSLLEADAPALVEWFESAEARAEDSELIREALAARTAGLEAADDPLGPWAMSLEGGDAKRGELLFRTKSETSCTRCHAWNGEGGSEAGPSLLGVAERLTTEQLLASIVTPNATIAEGFDAWLFGLEDGDVVSGRILSESDELVVIETNEKEEIELEPGEITARRRDVSAMPADISTHLSRREMRDLIAFLASL